MSVSASIKQSWGEGVYLLGNQRKLHRSELLPWLLTAMKTGLCIQSESLGSQSLTDWLRNKAAPPSGGQELQIPALSLIPPPPNQEKGRGAIPPTVLARTTRHTPTGSQPFRLSMAAAKLCCSWSQRNVEQSLEFFFCGETSTFEFQIPFRPPEPAHCLQESANSQSSLVRAWRVLGDFSLFIVFSRWQGCKTLLR